MTEATVSKPRAAAGWSAGVVGAVSLILATVSGVEGGFVDHKDDPGGATNHGVTQAEARACGFTGNMRDFTQAMADACLSDRYVHKPGFDGIVLRSTALGEEVIDQGVNFGPHRPSCYLQTALNSLNEGGRIYADLKLDCSVGPATLKAFDMLAARRGNDATCRVLLKLMDAQQGAEYLRLTQKVNPRLESFMFGWARQRMGNVPLEQCAKGGAK